jgi:hypothetical protein
MKKNKKYLEAAELLVHNTREYEGCCYFLGRVNQDADNFNDIFKPDRSVVTDYYFGSVLSDESNLARSLALLFMYEMGEK